MCHDVVVFVKTTRRKRGDKSYEYLSLVETVRDGDRIGHRTLLRLGEVTALRSSGQLDRIIAALRRHAEDSWMNSGELEATDAPAIGATWSVWAYWQRLGLHEHFAAIGEAKSLSYDLASATFAMVANRLVAPSSKRQIPEWVTGDVACPEGFVVPELDHLYWALDQVAAAKEATETHLYGRLCDLTNLDLRLVCYDLTSTYFETTAASSERFESRAFGYSRDKRGDRPQVVIGLLVTGDGLPIAHHVFSGDTNDVTTLPAVLDDLAGRFAIRGVAVVADRGLISAANITALDAGGFDHVLATRLHGDTLARTAIAASATPDATWVAVPEANSAACDVTIDAKRCVVVASGERLRRDNHRRVELIAHTEAQLLALEDRVRAGRIKDKARIAAAAERILGDSGIRRVFDIEIDEGRFIYHYDQSALDYEELLAGRYVLTTSLPSATVSTGWVVNAYRSLQEVENRFRVLKNFLGLRPVYHWTENRVRAHIAICVYAALIEALMSADLAAADVRDPDLDNQHLTAVRALRELGRVRQVTLTTDDNTTINIITKRNALQAQALSVFGVDTKPWDRAQIQPS